MAVTVMQRLAGRARAMEILNLRRRKTYLGARRSCG
jgi:deoxyadenosine/deoxycytidine kinase